MNGRVRMNIRLLTLEERSLGVPAECGEVREVGKTLHGGVGRVVRLLEPSDHTSF